MKSARILATLTATLITFGSLAGGANGAVIVTYGQVGGDVVFNYSGSFDVDGINPGIFTLNNIIAFGNQAGYDDNFININGSFSRILSSGTITQIAGGTGGFFTNNFGQLFASSNSGDTFSIQLGGGTVFAPSGYLAGQVISGSATFSGQTIAGLGLVNSSFDIGAGGVVSFAAVPEPSSALILGLGTLGLVARRRRIK